MTALKEESGRRVVLLFTDGHDTPDARPVPVTFRDVRARSVAENIMVYGIGFSSACGQSPGGWGTWFPSQSLNQRRRPGRVPPPIQFPRPPLPRPRPPVITGPGEGGVGRYPSPPPPVRTLPCQEAGPDPGSQGAGERRRRWLLRADAGGRSRSDLRARRRRAPSAVSAGVHAREARRRSAQARSESPDPEPHGTGETELRGSTGLVHGYDGCDGYEEPSNLRHLL